MRSFAKIFMCICFTGDLMARKLPMILYRSTIFNMSKFQYINRNIPFNSETSYIRDNIVV
jgi:hypothetical protein